MSTDEDVRRRRLRAVYVSVAILAMLLVSVCLYFRIYTLEDVIVYVKMLHSGQYDPVWRTLALRRARKGDPVDELIARHPPLWVYSFSPYVRLEYSYGAIDVVAKDGRLAYACAGWHDWEHRFFDMDEAERAAYEKAESEHDAESRFQQQLPGLREAMAWGRMVFVGSGVASPVGSPPPGAGRPGGPGGPGMGGSEWRTVEVVRVIQGDISVGDKIQVREWLRPGAKLAFVLEAVEDRGEGAPASSGRTSSVPVEVLDRHLEMSEDERSQLEEADRRSQEESVRRSEYHQLYNAMLTNGAVFVGQLPARGGSSAGSVTVTVRRVIAGSVRVGDRITIDDYGLSSPIAEGKGQSVILVEFPRGCYEAVSEETLERYRKRGAAGSRLR